MTIYFEDFVVGHTFELGSVDVTEHDIVEFATRYDPQSFHVDPELAEQSVYGGLIASGWHTCALYMRLLCDGMMNDSSSRGSPGMDELRWLAPVRPGDRLWGRYTVRETTPSASKPDRGTVNFLSEMVNQDGVVVFRMLGRGHYGRRPT